MGGQAIQDGKDKEGKRRDGKEGGRRRIIDYEFPQSHTINLALWHGRQPGEQQGILAELSTTPNPSLIRAHYEPQIETLLPSEHDISTRNLLRE